MPREELLDMVQRLRREIDSDAPVGPEQLAHLREALEEIETLLQSQEAVPAQHESILARLREAEGRFERTHPNFAEAVRAVTDALSKLGI